ncbi:MAG: hypothetical protein MJA27_21310 [Pseudanabaenales cyanobacterium]|nr:hypothetical protein [Pseudanabaenales cyanobacterium]
MRLRLDFCDLTYAAFVELAETIDWEGVAIAAPRSTGADTNEFTLFQAPFYA